MQRESLKGKEALGNVSLGEEEPLGLGSFYASALGSGDLNDVEAWRGLCSSLRAAQPAHLARGVRARAEEIQRLAEAWRGGERLEEIIEIAAREAGISPEMLRWGMEETLGRWRVEGLLGLVREELGRVGALDVLEEAQEKLQEEAQEKLQEEAQEKLQEEAEEELQTEEGAWGSGEGGSSWAISPTLWGEVLASTVPPAGLQSLVMVWLVGGAVLVRPSRSISTLMRAFIASLPEVAPGLANVTAMVQFSGEDEARCSQFVEAVDGLIVYGGDATIERWRSLSNSLLSKDQRPWSGLFVAHGHRVSAAYISAEALKMEGRGETLSGLALDLCAWDQSGCLSPVAVFVEQPASVTLEVMGEELVAHHLPKVEALLPPGEWPLGAIAARTSHLRGWLMAAEVLESSSAAIVVHDQVEAVSSCLHRVLHLFPVRSSKEAVGHLIQWKPHLQSLGVAGDAALKNSLARALVSGGLNRVCDLGSMQRPPLSWRHDGVGAIAPLVRWIEVEVEAPMTAASS